MTPPADLTRAAPATPPARERPARARARQAAEIGGALDRIAALLAPDARLAVAFEHGEFRLTANHPPVFDRVFLSAEEGGFIALQWRLAPHGAAFVGETAPRVLPPSALRHHRAQAYTSSS